MLLLSYNNLASSCTIHLCLLRSLPLSVLFPVKKEGDVIVDVGVSGAERVSGAYLCLRSYSALAVFCIAWAGWISILNRCSCLCHCLRLSPVIRCLVLFLWGRKERSYCSCVGCRIWRYVIPMSFCRLLLIGRPCDSSPARLLEGRSFIMF